MTLVESERAEDRNRAIDLLICAKKGFGSMIHPYASPSAEHPALAKAPLSKRSGLKAISKGHKVGVITIDPTSSLSHGSILGDKSRMAGLSTTSFSLYQIEPRRFGTRRHGTQDAMK